MNKFEQHYSSTIVPIELEDVTFHVDLPTTRNMRFQREVASRFVSYDSETGELTSHDPESVKPSQMVVWQIEAMVRTCIIRVDGWDEFTPEQLLAYPQACEDLWAKVTKLNAEKEAEADAIAKKPLSTSGGQKSGQVKESSTKPLQVAEG